MQVYIECSKLIKSYILYVFIAGKFWNNNKLIKGDYLK